MNNAIDNTKSRKNYSEIALYYLREQIIDGKLQPGEKIIENNISEKLNISRGPVRDALKQLAGETAIYGLSTILARVINFLFVPFYTRLLVPEQYGVVTELLAYIAVLQVALVMGLETGCFRFASKEGIDKDKVYTNAFLSVFAVNAAWSAVDSLPDRIGDWHLHKLQVPTVFGEAAETAIAAAIAADHVSQSQNSKQAQHCNNPPLQSFVRTGHPVRVQDMTQRK